MTTTVRSPGWRRPRARRATSSSSSSDGAAQTSQGELYQSILGYKGEAENTLKQAQELNVPGDMTAAQQSLLISLELRRDGLASVAEEIRKALSDDGDAASQAIESIAGDMRAFDASDVLYDSRVDPVHQVGVLGRRDRRSDDREVAVPQGDLLGLAAATWPRAWISSSRPTRARTAPVTASATRTSRPARACTAPAWTRPPTATSRCSPARRTASPTSRASPSPSPSPTRARTTSSTSR